MLPRCRSGGTIAAQTSNAGYVSQTQIARTPSSIAPYTQDRDAQFEDAETPSTAPAGAEAAQSVQATHEDLPTALEAVSDPAPTGMRAIKNFWQLVRMSRLTLIML